jgi:CheY-like chemotaxis protein
LDPSQPLLGLTVLVVEDDPLVADVISETFKIGGAEILGPAPTVRAALELLDSTAHVNAAVLDWQLGQENTADVARELQRRTIPFVFATASVPSEIRAVFPDAVLFQKGRRSTGLIDFMMTCLVQKPTPPPVST